MIAAVAFCPVAPVLVPVVAQGAAGELDELRAACRTAIGSAAGPGRRWIVVGPGGTSRRFAAASRGTLAGFGVPFEIALGADGAGPVELPPALTVGAWLLRDALGPGCGAVGWSVRDATDAALTGWDAAARAPDDDWAVLVLGDGSARRSVRAPGYLDEHAEPFDARVAAALRSGDPGRLRGLDDDHDLLETGTPVWELVARSLAGTSWAPELLYDEAPYGVGYFVASWRRRA